MAIHQARRIKRIRAISITTKESNMATKKGGSKGKGGGKGKGKGC
jgi:hypothetical protein